MTAAQASQLFQERVMPQLAELGVEAFACVGYLRDGEGKVARFTFGTSGDNPAYDDGLKGMHVISQKWAAGEL